MKSVCLVHFSPEVFATLGAPKAYAACRSAAPPTMSLAARGQLLGAEALEWPNDAVLVKSERRRFDGAASRRSQPAPAGALQSRVPSNRLQI